MMRTTGTNIRLAALGAAAVIVTALFATIVANMPPEFDGGASVARAVVQTPAVAGSATLPLRIEVFGVRTQETAARDEPDVASAPRS